MTAIWGLVFGFLSSTPIGPINLSIMQEARQGQLRSVLFFTGGVVLADLLVAGLAFFGLVQAHLSTERLRLISVVGGLVFLSLAFWSWKKSEETFEQKPIPQPKLKWKFLTGFLFCSLNPGFFLFWIYASSFVLSEILALAKIDSALAFLFGILIGDLLWFSFFSVLAFRSRKILSERSWRRLSALLMAGLSLFALWGGWNGNFKT